MSRPHFFLFYMSCFGHPDHLYFSSRRSALATVRYLHQHSVSYPLYLVTVRLR